MPVRKKKKKKEKHAKPDGPNQTPAAAAAAAEIQRESNLLVEFNSGGLSVERRYARSI